MTRGYIGLGLVLLWCGIAAATDAPESALPKPPEIPAFARQVPRVKSGDPVFAFNGKNLDGWYTFLRDHKLEDPDHVFSVKDGQIVISGQEFGGLTTRKSYGNYHLITEWKWGERQWEILTPKVLARPKGCSRDAGIMIHGTGPDGAGYGNWLESIEVQVIEGGVGDFLVVGGKGTPSLTVESVHVPELKQWWFQPGAPAVTKRGGRFNWWGRDPQWTDTSGIRDKFNVEKPHGEWNRQEVICEGDSITMILNGYVVNHGTRCDRTEGKIQLESEGAEIIFRKFEVRPLIK